MSDKPQKPNKKQNDFDLNLPQTEFPMRANLPTREPQWLERWLKDDIYGQVRKARKGAEKFILHCGPPYANGGLHLGHVMSYVLKDFVVRSQSMMGKDAPFVPGWDCHGLPIEWKVEQDLRKQKKSKDDLSVKELRDLCRAEAEKWVAVQVEDWKRMGSLGDWDGRYETKNPQNEAGIIRSLGQIAAKGLLYRGQKSVMWSPAEQTALAEAEIEYDDNHVSTAIYVAYPVQGTANEYVVIWTTTPWTMPGSRGVAYGEGIEYAQIEQGGKRYWVAKSLVSNVAEKWGWENVNTVAEQAGTAFEGTKLQHPLYGHELPMFAGHHVSDEDGTGFVHTNPAHGPDDFMLGQKFGLSLACPVQGNGTYDDSLPTLPKTGENLHNVHIYKAEPAILAELEQGANLLHQYKHKHSYPISWRSKKPLIHRAVPQWFIAFDNDQNLRSNCVAEIDNVAWYPESGHKRIRTMMENRPDWCISRQRAWGVPITVFYGPNGEPILDADVFEHVAQQVEQHGIDAWETLSTEELLPAEWLEAKGYTADQLTKETDILDVWFDSGSTHHHVMQQHADLKNDDGSWQQADMYSEGTDQYRGWFQSSLSTSVAMNGKSPYKSVLAHGYVVDGTGRKFSKSLGNGIAPSELLQKYGMDIIRLWVASANVSQDVRVSDEIMKGVSDSYRRFRNTFKYLLGNLSDFDAERDAVVVEDMPPLERYVLSELHTVLTTVRECYNGYRFQQAYQTLYHFCNETLSSLYFDVRKDSLYCDARVDNGNAQGMYQRRRSCQTVLHILLESLTTALNPVLPFTTDEVWRSYFGDDANVHAAVMTEPESSWQLETTTAWQQVMAVRDEVLQQLEQARTAGTIKANLDAQVTLGLTADEQSQLDFADWAELLVASEVSVETWDGSGERPVRVTKHTGEKCQRSWKYSHELTAEGITQRDAAAMAANQNIEAAA